MHRTKREALLRSINSVIETYGAADPDLARELEAIRDDLLEAERTSQWIVWSQRALQAATWIKFILDRLPPPH